MFPFLFKVERANDALVATTLRRDDLYPTVIDQCESDLLKFCSSSPLDVTNSSDVGGRELTILPALIRSGSAFVDSTIPETALNDKQAGNAPSDRPGAVLKVPHTQQLRTAPFHSRRLAEEAISDTVIFPYECLETAWRKHLVSLKCGTSLFQLRGVEELKQQQQRNCKTASWVFGANWCWLVWCSGIGRHLSALFYFLLKSRFIMWDFFIRYNFFFMFVPMFLFFSTGSFILLPIFWIMFLLPAIAEANSRTEGGISNEEDRSPVSEQECITGQTETSGCSCCKTPSYSDNPSNLSETCCECCMGSGVCSAACESCCDKECCMATRAELDVTTEHEILIPALVAGDHEM